MFPRDLRCPQVMTASQCPCPQLPQPAVSSCCSQLCAAAGVSLSGQCGAGSADNYTSWPGQAVLTKLHANNQPLTARLKPPFYCISLIEFYQIGAIKIIHLKGQIKCNNLFAPMYTFRIVLCRKQKKIITSKSNYSLFEECREMNRETFRYLIVISDQKYTLQNCSLLRLC